MISLKCNQIILTSVSSCTQTTCSGKGTGRSYVCAILNSAVEAWHELAARLEIGFQRSRPILVLKQGASSLGVGNLQMQKGKRPLLTPNSLV